MKKIDKVNYLRKSLLNGDEVIFCYKDYCNFSKTDTAKMNDNNIVSVYDARLDKLISSFRFDKFVEYMFDNYKGSKVYAGMVDKKHKMFNI